MEATGQKHVSEAIRERETYLYDASLIAETIRKQWSQSSPAPKLRTCSDSTLTALVQLAAIQLGGTRAFLSLFDRDRQYVVAEAGPKTPITPAQEINDGVSPLLLCGTAISRTASLCENVFLAPYVASPPHPEGLPVSFIPDIAAYAAKGNQELCQPFKSSRFYAGVPVRSKRNIDFGVLCVVGDQEMEKLDPASVTLLQDLSKALVAHFDAQRSKDEHRRASRMIRGMGSFVEGYATISSIRGEDVKAAAEAEQPGREGGLNVKQQELQRQRVASSIDSAAASERRDSLASEPDETAHPQRPRFTARQSSTTIPTSTFVSPKTDTSKSPLTNKQHEDELEHIFSKAANIIRESIEVEGVVFLDMTVSSFGGRVNDVPEVEAKKGKYSYSSSSDDRRSSDSNKSRDSLEEVCATIGFSTSASASIDGDSRSKDQISLSKRFLHKLLRRHPNGQIFNFDETGSIQSSASGEESADQSDRSTAALKSEGSSLPPRTPREIAQSRKAMTRQNEGKTIVNMFSDARSIAFMPVWDSGKKRWHAVGFAWTRTPTRILSREGELSYLDAFSSTIMAAITRVHTSLGDKAKMDLMSSLSHELRSPLHGVILGAELLHDTRLDTSQVEYLRSIETCGRTLLDTMDHLLDWSKINNFVGNTTSRRRSGTDQEDRGLRGSTNTIEAGMMSLSSQVAIDVLAEEVVESVCAGHLFQRLTLSASNASNSTEQHPSKAQMKKLDSVQAMESLASTISKSGDILLVLGDVSVTLEVDPDLAWMFYTQPGAIRRIIMNIVGNALKHTTQGFVKVIVTHHPLSSRKPNNRVVRIAVTDSGRGISRDYLQNHIFTPFSQEDRLNTGAGLGLSLVKQIVTALGGSIRVQSRIGEGTAVTVKLPLEQVPQASIPGRPECTADDFDSEVAQLKGLRVLILGFPAYQRKTSEGDASWVDFDEYASMVKVCQGWLKMQVIEPQERADLSPELVLCTEKYMAQHHHNTWKDTLTPTVVVCRNALVARKVSTSNIGTRTFGPRIFEFTSQPIGPRKLAKVLALSFNRWIESVPTPDVEMFRGLHDEDVNLWAQMDNGYPATEASASPELMPSPPNIRTGTTSPTAAGAAQASFTQARLPEQIPLPESPSPHEATLTVPPFLLVEDNKINLKILNSFMKKMGHKYEEAMDGKQAVEAVQRCKGTYKCILMDISMPIMDGFEATRNIRAYEKENHISPRCVIIALTGLASTDAQQEAFASGIDLFLTKPVRLKELSQILRQRGL